jgi:hypothetical protein
MEADIVQSEYPLSRLALTFSTIAAINLPHRLTPVPIFVRKGRRGKTSSADLSYSSSSEPDPCFAIDFNSLYERHRLAGGEARGR